MAREEEREKKEKRDEERDREIVDCCLRELFGLVD